MCLYVKSSFSYNVGKWYIKLRSRRYIIAKYFDEPLCYTFMEMSIGNFENINKHTVLIKSGISMGMVRV